MSTILYIVDATSQLAERQITEARAAGFAFSEVLVDEGASGIGTSLRGRAKGKQLFERLGQGDTLVVRWIDHLGRNYPDMTRAIQNFLDQGVTIRTVIGGVTLYGSPDTPDQKTMTETLIAFMNATADAQAAVFENAYKTGLGSARGGKNVSRGRRPSYDEPTLNTVLDMLSNGAATIAIAEVTGLSTRAIARIKRDPVNAKNALLRWESPTTDD